PAARPDSRAPPPAQLDPTNLEGRVRFCYSANSTMRDRRVGPRAQATAAPADVDRDAETARLEPQVGALGARARLATMVPTPALPPEEPGEYRTLFASLHRTLEASDCFLGSMPALASRAAMLGKEAFVHPNLVSPALVRLSRLLAPLRHSPRRPPTIAYVSGSNTPDRDPAMIARPLA